MQSETKTQKVSNATAWTAELGWAAAVLIAAVSFVFMSIASRGDSAIMDELAHIPAGYGYVNQLDYRLNPEHPPLLKAIAAFPLLFENVRFPTENSAWQTDINGQWEMGAEFLYQSENDADHIVRVARMGPMLLTAILILLIYAWAKELLGKFWALVPTFLFAFSPTVLAHGHYVTTDVAAAFGVVAATYYFMKFLLAPSRRHLFYAGLSFGAAELLKFSTVLLVPYFIILIAAFYAASVIRDREKTKDRFRRFAVRAFRYIRSLIFIFVIGYVLVVYPVYFLFTANYPIHRQGSDTQVTLTSFAGGETAAGHLCKPLRCVANLDIWMAKNPVTRPFAEYLLGVLMVIQRSAGGNTNYFLGKVSATGSHLYFPIVYLLKEPLPALILVLLGLVLGIWGIIKKIKNQSASWRTKIKNNFSDYLGTNFPEFGMIVFVIFYWAWSMKSPLNIGYRHLLPTLPFIYILAASALKKWATAIPAPSSKSNFQMIVQRIKTAFTRSIRYFFILATLLWFFAETVFAAPYFLSYFNELAGGPWNGYRYVTDSNADWGQDMLRLKEFVAAHPEIDKIAVDYFGGGNPKYYLGAKEEGWWSSRGNPSTGSGQVPPIHWLAVSVNTLESAIQPTVSGQKRNPEDEYRWLTQLRRPAPGLGNLPEPDYKAGTSIFIYKL